MILLLLPIALFRLMLGAVKANATDAANAWSTGMGAAGPKYTAGIMAVKTAPGQLAAAAKDRYVAGVNNNVNKYAANVAKVTLPAWQELASGKGAQRLASGATAALPKVQAFMQGFLPVLTGIVNSLPPRGDFNANLGRFTAYATALHNQAGNF